MATKAELEKEIAALLDLAHDYTDGLTCIWCSGEEGEHEADCEGEKARKMCE